MLKARWKGNTPAPSAAPDPLAEGQIRSFKITKLVADSKKIEVELTIKRRHTQSVEVHTDCESLTVKSQIVAGESAMGIYLA